MSQQHGYNTRNWLHAQSQQAKNGMGQKQNIL